MNNKYKHNFIGLFDSGFGGISVLNYCIKFMPNENYIYYADSNNRPYGTKTKNQLIQIGKSIVNQFNNLSPKQIIIACGTMSTASIIELKSLYKNLSIIGTYPNFEHLLSPKTIINEKQLTFNTEDGVTTFHNKKKVLILATKATCNSEYVQDKIENYKNIIDIYAEPADEIVKFVENYELENIELDTYLKRILSKYNHLDYIVLGCTHFAFVKHIIKKYIDENTIITSGSEAAARLCQSRNIVTNLESEKPFIKIIDSMIDDKRKETYLKLLCENSYKYNITFDMKF